MSARVLRDEYLHMQGSMACDLTPDLTIGAAARVLECFVQMHPDNPDLKGLSDVVRFLDSLADRIRKAGPDEVEHVLHDPEVREFCARFGV